MRFKQFFHYTIIHVFWLIICKSENFSLPFHFSNFLNTFIDFFQALKLTGFNVMEDAINGSTCFVLALINVKLSQTMIIFVKYVKNHHHQQQQIKCQMPQQLLWNETTLFKKAKKKCINKKNQWPNIASIRLHIMKSNTYRDFLLTQ